MTRFFWSIIACLFFNSVNAQLSQYAIGTAGNEIATKVHFLPSDQATIIAGYTYDYTGTAASNCQAIIMKVNHGGTIAWQKTFGISGKDNLIQDMIITHDGNIVVVGTINRTSIYVGNTAAIMKFSSADGSLIWQKCIRDTPYNTAGEIFIGVTELTDGTNRLVAVGGTNFVPAHANGLICTFQSDGTLISNEVLGTPSTDYFTCVTTSAAGNSVYIGGVVTGNYTDGQVISYTPGTDTGTVNWSKSFDFYLNGTLQDNFFSAVNLSGTKLLLSGYSYYNYTVTGGEGLHVLSINAADGSSPQLRGIINSGTNYSNSAVIAIDSSDHIFTAQSPGSIFYDPTLWVSGIITNTVITEITSLAAKTHNTPVRFTSPETGEHSFVDMRFQSGLLFLAGGTNVPSGFGNNDIYYVITAPTLASMNHNCDTTHDSVIITDTTLTSPPYTLTSSHIVPSYSAVPLAASTLAIKALCGDPDVTTGSLKILSPELSIYPNPVNKYLSIVAPYTIRSVEITNLLGKTVFTATFNSKEVTINTSILQKGMYFIKINDNLMKSIVKE